MPRLKSLELQGYKTFASKTRFEFAEGITAIVGPNGSGKSNIADSIRWVLGEQAYGLLRGKKTEDMIYSGSEQRPRAGMASALITFDNSDGGFPIEYSEVTFGRAAYRDGGNEYLLNDQRVRLKDIDELLARCGLSERTYTIIGQGLVDSALSLKPEERRRLFEEAAGIGLYRARREESLRRLETTKHNLERVLDILTELQPRVKSLERQAKRASEYDTVRDDLKDVLRQWYGYHWHLSQEDVKQSHALADASNKALTTLRETQEQTDGQFLELRNTLNALRAQLNTWHRQASELHRTREALSRELAVHEERLRSSERAREEAAATLATAQTDQASLEERSSALAADRERLQTEIDEIKRQLQQAQAAQEAHEAERQDRSRRREELRTSMQTREAGLARNEARSAQLEERKVELATREATVQAACIELRAMVEAHTHKLVEVHAAWEAEQARREQAQTLLDRSTEAVRAALEAVDRARSEVAEKTAEQEKWNARREVLQQAEKELLGYGNGLRHLVGLAQQGELSGIAGALSGQLEVPAEYESAISAALGEFQDSLLIQDSTNLDAALDRLGGSRAGRAGLLALPLLIPPEPLSIPADGELIGRASDLVRAPASLRPAVEALLGAVVLVRTRMAARRVLAQLPAHARVVTLAGEVFHPAGAVMAGGAESSASLSRARELREAEAKLGSVRETVARAEQELTQQEDALRRAQEAVDQLQRTLAEVNSAEQKFRIARDDARTAQASKEEELRWQENRVGELGQESTLLREEEKRLTAEASELRTQLESASAEEKEAARRLQEVPLADANAERMHWQTRAALAEQALREWETRRAEAARSLVRAQELLGERQSRIQALDADQASLESSLRTLREEELRVGASISETQAQIEPAETRLAEVEAEQARLEAAEAESRTRLHSAERQYTQAQVDLARRLEELEGLRRRVEDDFGLVEFEYATEVTGPTPLPLADLVEKLPIVESLAPELEDLVNRRRTQLRRMGAINAEAPLEYKEVKERFEFLTAQVADLRQAESELREVIAELDTLMQTAFQRTFQAVSEEFPKIFQRLFGGGTAKLTLMEGDNPSESGIDITARLPGKRPQGLALLSGGERSLTSAALVFSLLKVSPTPFCVLDEVDAMLDESNVGRFRDLLVELSARTQFVVVTHNRNTVQAAQVIYGISMGSDSSSQIISLRLDEFVGRS
jgi:chromosome segregation protein